MTEEEALVNVDEIGQAFANDLNDGDDDVLYHGLITYREGQKMLLQYKATLKDGSEHTFRWVLTLLDRKVKR